MGSYLQQDFLQNRYLKDNIKRVQNIINLATITQDPTVLYFTDTEKEFDRVEWLFLKDTMANMNFGPFMLQWLNLITQNQQELLWMDLILGRLSKWNPYWFASLINLRLYITHIGYPTSS